MNNALEILSNANFEVLEINPAHDVVKLDDLSLAMVGGGEVPVSL